MIIERIAKEDWQRLSETAHEICFAEKKPAAWDRIDFALLAVEDLVPIGYITCREIDAHTLYWQFGGAFPGTKDTIKSFSAYQAMVRYASERYKRVATYIENTNRVMLKMAGRCGFLITGIRVFDGDILVEHCLEFHADR